MGFIRTISVDGIEDAPTMARCLRALILDVFDPSETTVYADDDDDPDRRIGHRELSFIVAGPCDTNQYRITVTSAESEPSPLVVGRDKAEVVALVRELEADEALLRLRSAPVAGVGSRAIIDRIAPGSIRSIDDMVTALELVLRDSFAAVGSSDGRRGNVLSFVVDGDTIDVGFKIAVHDYDCEPEMFSEEERRLVQAARRLGISAAQGIYRLCTDTDGLDDDMTMEGAARELEQFIERGRRPGEDDRDDDEGESAPMPLVGATSDDALDTAASARSGRRAGNLLGHRR